MCHRDSAGRARSRDLQNTSRPAGRRRRCQLCRLSRRQRRSPARTNPQSPDVSFGPKWALTYRNRQRRLPGPATRRKSRCSGWAACTSRKNWPAPTATIPIPARDPMLTADGQLDNCLSCHARQQAQMRLPSRHPILEGKTACSDCHNPHGAHRGHADRSRPSTTTATNATRKSAARTCGNTSRWSRTAATATTHMVRCNPTC